jgi:transcription antitermination factor NusG
MSITWYTYHSHPHKEDSLCRQIEAIGLEYFYPHLKIKPVNPRSKHIRPYFPGYLFVHADLEVCGINTLQFLPYSKGLVQFGGEPAGVPDELIAAIRNRLDLLNTKDREPTGSQFKHGDAVRISGGVFEGYKAIFDENLSGTERSRVLLKTLYQYSLKIEINNSELNRVPPGLQSH